MRFSEQTEAENPHFPKILADVLPADRKIRLEPSIGYLPQKPYAFRMSVRKNILLGGRDIQKAESLAKALSLTELEHKRAGSSLRR